MWLNGIESTWKINIQYKKKNKKKKKKKKKKNEDVQGVGSSDVVAHPILGNTWPRVKNLPEG